MRVKALQKIYYNKQERAVGDEYEMDDREEGEAKILATIGKLQILEDEPAKPVATPVPEGVTSRALGPQEEQPQPSKPIEPLTTESAAPLTQGKRGYYRRRDLKAEE